MWKSSGVLSLSPCFPGQLGALQRLSPSQQGFPGTVRAPGRGEVRISCSSCACIAQESAPAPLPLWGWVAEGRQGMGMRSCSWPEKGTAGLGCSPGALSRQELNCTKGVLRTSKTLSQISQLYSLVICVCFYFSRCSVLSNP